MSTAWSQWTDSFAGFMAQLDREKAPYLSHSQVALFERCRCCYHRQYIQGKQPDFPAMQVGTLFHESAHALYSSPTSPTPTTLFNGLNTESLDEERHEKLQNAITLLCQHRWVDVAVVSVEVPFIMELTPDLPPVIGVPDLVLSDAQGLKVIDHKTSTKFNDLDDDQLVLYAEHLRRSHPARPITGYFDEYRLVSNLATIRKPAFLRTEVAVDESLMPALMNRYHAAWKGISAMSPYTAPSPADDCWLCRPARH